MCLSCYLRYNKLFNIKTTIFVFCDFQSISVFSNSVLFYVQNEILRHLHEGAAMTEKRKIWIILTDWNNYYKRFCLVRRCFFAGVPHLKSHTHHMSLAL